MHLGCFAYGNNEVGLSLASGAHLIETALMKQRQLHIISQIRPCPLNVKLHYALVAVGLALFSPGLEPRFEVAIVPLW